MFYILPFRDSHLSSTFLSEKESTDVIKTYYIINPGSDINSSFGKCYRIEINILSGMPDKFEFGLLEENKFSSSLSCEYKFDLSLKTESGVWFPNEIIRRFYHNENISLYQEFLFTSAEDILLDSNYLFTLTQELGSITN